MGSNARGSRIAEFDLHDQQKRFEASGKTVVMFCREEGIPVSTFYQRRAHWKKRVREGRTAITQRKAPFIDVGTAVLGAPVVTSKIPEYPERQSADWKEVRIDLGGGVVVHVTRS